MPPFCQQFEVLHERFISLPTCKTKKSPKRIKLFVFLKHFYTLNFMWSLFSIGLTKRSRSASVKRAKCSGFAAVTLSVLIWISTKIHRIRSSYVPPKSICDLHCLPHERKVLGFSSRTACPPQAAAALLKRPRWRAPPCERFYRFLLQRSRGTRDPTAVNFSRAGADRAASRSGNHYVSHGFTTCGPSCLLPLILWSGCSHTLPGTQGGAFLRGDVSRLLCLREENQQYLGGLVEGGDARQK